MKNCNHPDNKRITEENLFSYKCILCGTSICIDCGTTPVHIDSSSHNCKKCGEKNGYRYEYITEIDNDKLRQLVGNKLADNIFKECKA